MVVTISIITPIVVGRRRSPVVILVPVIVSVIISVTFSVIAVIAAVVISMIASPSAATTAPVPTQSEAWPRRLAVMEVDSGRGPVRRLGDAEVNPDLEAGDLGSIHRLPRLLRILGSLEVDKRESPGSLGWAVQHHLDLRQFAKSAKLPVQVSLCGREVETEHSNTV